MTTPLASRSIARTDQLLITYEARGPEDGSPVLLLHGWPDDVRAWDAVAAALAEAGHRVIAPFLRGFGPTSFREASTLRTAQPVALADDAVQLLDALDIQQTTVIGHDWGARTGYVMAALWPKRVERLVALASPHVVGTKPGSELDYNQQHAYWYQWFFGSERGREALQDNRRELCRYLWRSWSPTWQFTEVEFEQAASSWDNPDWVEVTLHSYRVRWGNAPKDPGYAALQAKLEKGPMVKVPTIFLHGGADACSLPSESANQAKMFPEGYHRQVLPGIGHFIPREQPDAVLNALLAK